MRRSRFHRRSGTRRKMVWQSANVYASNANWLIGNNSQLATIFVSFLRWPAGVPQITTLGELKEEEDWTITRMLVNWGWLDTGDGSDFNENTNYFIFAGILPWDDMDGSTAVFIDNGGAGAVFFDGDGGAPDPRDGSYDWLWRNVQPVSVRGSNFAFGAPLNSLQMSSKAQRKLPAHTALTFHMSVWSLPGGGTSDVSLNMGADVRMLFKKS